MQRVVKSSLNYHNVCTDNKATIGCVVLQLACVARVLLLRPLILVMDECLEVLGEPSAKNMFVDIIRPALPQATIVIITVSVAILKQTLVASCRSRFKLRVRESVITQHVFFVM